MENDMKIQRKRTRLCIRKEVERNKLSNVFRSKSHEKLIQRLRQDIQNASKHIDNSSPKKFSTKMYSRTTYKNRQRDIDNRLKNNLKLVCAINEKMRRNVTFNVSERINFSKLPSRILDLQQIDRENEKISKILKSIPPSDACFRKNQKDHWDLHVLPTCISKMKYPIAINTLLTPGIDPFLENPPTLEEYQRNRKVFFVFRTENGEKIGKIQIMLDCEADSSTIQKFIDLCCNGYKNCKVYKILPELYLECGDITENDGRGKDENSPKIYPSKKSQQERLDVGSVSMILETDCSVGSKFAISLKKTPKLDNRQVVIGRVIKGLEVVVALEQFGSRFGRPRKDVFVENCGIIK